MQVANIIKAPDDPSQWPAFREELITWREQARHELNYNDALYRRPDFAWVPGNYACYFLLLSDERFYDPTSNSYRVQEWLEFSRREFSGFDSVVLWHAYPRIGFDERNQFDFYRDAPGGLAGLHLLVDQLHRAGLRVFTNYNPWDQHTRREAKDDVDMIAEFVGALGADGVFLDTMKEGAAEFRTKLDAVRPGVVLESEMALPVERIADHHMSWAQDFEDSAAPGVVRNKWFERRHQLHHTARWEPDSKPDRTHLAHAAFMNGTGLMIWDNIFGTWNGYSEQEKSIFRTLLPIQRRFTSLFSGEKWTPLVPTLHQSIFASCWEGEGVRLWTLVNRSAETVGGELLTIERQPGEPLWDLVAGHEVPSARALIRPRGIACFVAGRLDQLGADFGTFLGSQRAIDARANWATTSTQTVETKLRPAPSSLSIAAGTRPAEMAVIPGGRFHSAVEFQVRECGWYESTRENISNFFPHHQPAQREFDTVIAPFAMDLTPVTNAQFAEFLRASGYRPEHERNFLKNWTDDTPQRNQADHPVVYIDLNDARAYARWAGKRLPTEHEWQLAAQGFDGRRHPWGNEPPESRTDLCNINSPGTTPVRQFPNGRSPFGIYDLCGNTWEWTESERHDGVNRFAIIRGGSYYTLNGSVWYADTGPKSAAFGAKFMLGWPGLDRCATIGFRCVADLSP